MNLLLPIALIVIFILTVIIFIILALVTRSQVIDAITHPPEERPPMKETPGDYGLNFEDVRVTTEDGLALNGWYIPGENGATVMIQHGTPGGSQDGLHEAEFLNRHGYNVLLGSFRAHDESDGDLISFGYHEQKDSAAWHQYLLNRDDINPDKIGMFGESMGGGTAILYTAGNEDIQALATASAFALTQETIKTYIEFEVNPPNWITPILAGFFSFWAEREADFKTEDLDTEAVIGQISPRPVLIIHGGEDDKIGSDSGQSLFESAGEPKDFWFVPEAGHVNFELFRPDEYEQRVVAFFDQYLLGE